MRLNSKRTLLLFGMLIFANDSTRAEELLVAAASSLNYAMKEMIHRYQLESGETVRLSLGSSGSFYAQMIHGAPYDLFFSADVEYPRKLVQAGAGEAGSFIVYATGTLGLWVPTESPIDLARDGIEALRHPSVRKIAIANPRHAPFGRAAVTVLEHFGIHEDLRPKLVYGDNILQAAQFVRTGAVEIGLIALSLVASPSMRGHGRHWEIPTEAHDPLDQGAVILKRSRTRGNHDAAKRFLNWVLSVRGSSILQRHGFLPRAQPDRLSGGNQ